ncbi:Multidrug resistance protein [Yarrowia sp. B02]|nr:Multidrug resistance protein [Yarrowia sp. B02]
MTVESPCASSSTSMSEETPLLANENGAVANDGEPKWTSAQLKQMYKRSAILPALYIGAFLCSIDGTIVASTLNRVGADLNESDNVAWVATAYLLTNCAFQPLYGKLSDVFGRKQMLLFASFFFGLGNLMCGYAADFNWLIAGRAITGVGGGGLAAMSSIIVSDIVTIEERGIFQGYANINFGLGAMLGAPVGGLIADHLGWRYMFSLQVPFVLLSSFLVFRYVNIKPKKQVVSNVSTLERIDLFGSISIVCFLTLLLLVINMQDDTRSLSSDPTLQIMSVASAIFLAIFLYVEMKIAPEPIMTKAVFGHLRPTLLTTSVFFTTITQFSVIYYTPVFLQVVFLESAAQAGVRLIPLSIGVSSGSVIAGHILKKNTTQRYPRVFLTGLTIVGLSCCVLSRLINSSTPHEFTALAATLAHHGVSLELVLAVNLAFQGLAQGFILVSTLIGLCCQTGAADSASSIGVIYLFRSLGSVLGVNGVAHILQSRLRAELPDILADPELQLKVRKNVEFINHLAPAIQIEIRNVYKHALSFVFSSCSFITFIAFTMGFVVYLHSRSERQ